MNHGGCFAFKPGSVLVGSILPYLGSVDGCVCKLSLFDI